MHTFAPVKVVYKVGNHTIEDRTGRCRGANDVRDLIVEKDENGAIIYTKSHDQVEWWYENGRLVRVKFVTGGIREFDK